MEPATARLLLSEGTNTERDLQHHARASVMIGLVVTVLVLGAIASMQALWTDQATTNGPAAGALNATIIREYQTLSHGPRWYAIDIPAGWTRTWQEDHQRIRTLELYPERISDNPHDPVTASVTVAATNRSTSLVDVMYDEPFEFEAIASRPIVLAGEVVTQTVYASKWSGSHVMLFDASASVGDTAYFVRGRLNVDEPAERAHAASVISDVIASFAPIPSSIDRLAWEQATVSTGSTRTPSGHDRFAVAAYHVRLPEGWDPPTSASGSGGLAIAGAPLANLPVSIAVTPLPGYAAPGGIAVDQVGPEMVLGGLPRDLPVETSILGGEGLRRTYLMNINGQDHQVDIDFPMQKSDPRFMLYDQVASSIVRFSGIAATEQFEGAYP